ncbi:DUF6498-containing protein [Halogeometricum borinquense]|uniref:DUF6498-containing protein n=1 Tax=Halogeometricum borinquense TaxID=60847 RepID=UPI001F5C877E|nr:DUF6498-containing protein [Halogeometricum borinquense]
MLSNQGTNTSSVSFLPTLVANLLPFFGILLLDWRVGELLAVYWLEIGTALLGYSVAALFAQLPIVLDGRSFYLPGTGPDVERHEKWEREPAPVEVPGPLPPIYPRNIRLVLTLLIAGCFILGFFLFASPEFASPGILTALGSPSIALTAVGMILSDWYRLYREFFREKQYEEMSAYMVLEIPGRFLVFAASYVVLLSTVGMLTLASFLMITQTEFARLGFEFEQLVAGAMVLGKIAVEWSQFRTENEEDPTGFATWFRPDNPRE